MTADEMAVSLETINSNLNYLQNNMDDIPLEGVVLFAKAMKDFAMATTEIRRVTEQEVCEVRTWMI